MNEKERDELLIEIRTQLKVLIKGFDNHLNHHFRYNLFAWGVALSAIVGLVITIIKAL